MQSKRFVAVGSILALALLATPGLAQARTPGRVAALQGDGEGGAAGAKKGKKGKKGKKAKEEPKAAEPEPPPPPVDEPKAPEPAPVAEAPAAAGAAPSADEPADDRRISAALMVGYGSAGAGLGLGVRGGYRVTDRVYVGAAFTYHLGKSEEAGPVTASSSLLFTGAEVGYDIPVSALVVRPYLGLGLGMAMVSQSDGTNTQSDSNASLAVWPGVQGLFTIPSSPAFVGVDLRVLTLTEGNLASYAASITGGARF